MFEIVHIFNMAWLEKIWRLMRQIPHLRVNFNDWEEIFYGLQWVPTAAIIASLMSLE